MPSKDVQCKFKFSLFRHMCGTMPYVKDANVLLSGRKVLTKYGTVAAVAALSWEVIIRLYPLCLTGMGPPLYVYVKSIFTTRH